MKTKGFVRSQSDKILRDYFSNSRISFSLIEDEKKEFFVIFIRRSLYVDEEVYE